MGSFIILSSVLAIEDTVSMSLYFNNNVDVINNVLYEFYMSNVSDKLITIHNLIIEFINELSINNVDITDVNTINIYKRHGVNINMLYCNPITLDHLDDFINNFKLCIELTKNFDKYKYSGENV